VGSEWVSFKMEGISMEHELATVQAGQLTAVDIRKQVNLIQSVMKEVMQGPSKENPQGVHFGIIPGCKKPSLLKPGAEKIAMTFRLGARFEELPGSIENDTFICYKINCELFHIPTGLVVGNGRGTCNSKEKKYRTRMVYANKATPEEKAIGKLEDRVGDKGKYSVYVIPQDPWDVQNTIYKMAMKRAQVAAVLNCTAASDLFTQDIEDIPEGTVIDTEAAEPSSSKPSVSMPQSKTSQAKPDLTPAVPGELISVEEAGNLGLIAKKSGMSKEQFHQWLMTKFGYEEAKHILKDEYDKICLAAKGWKKDG
jgi:hypothetical protein